MEGGRNAARLSDSPDRKKKEKKNKEEKNLLEHLTRGYSLLVIGLVFSLIDWFLKGDSRCSFKQDHHDHHYLDLSMLVRCQ